MNRRALVIAIVVAALGVLLLLIYHQRFEVEASGGERIKVLIALKPIERGKPITEEVVATHEVPQAYVEDRAIKAAEKTKILGLKVGNTIQAQQTLMWTDLVSTNENERDLSSLIQPGNRAVAIRVSEDSTSLSLIRPGDYVDVISVMSQAGAALAGPGGGQQSSVVLLQRVLVLAAGDETSREGAIDRKDRNLRNDQAVLTLSVTTPEAQLLQLAQARGPLGVALRNPEDQRTANQIPDINSSSLLDSNQREVIRRRVTGGGPVRVGGTGENQ